MKSFPGVEALYGKLRRERRDTGWVTTTEAALLNANPHIRDLSKVRAGTLIVIPDFPDSPPLRDPQTVAGDAELSDHLKVALKEFSDAIDRLAQSEEQAAAATTALLKGPDIKDFLEVPELEEQFKRIDNYAKNRLKEATAAKKAQNEALAQLQEALGKLP